MSGNGLLLRDESLQHLLRAFDNAPSRVLVGHQRGMHSKKKCLQNPSLVSGDKGNVTTAHGRRLRAGEKKEEGNGEAGCSPSTCIVGGPCHSHTAGHGLVHRTNVQRVIPRRLWCLSFHNSMPSASDAYGLRASRGEGVSTRCIVPSDLPRGPSDWISRDRILHALPTAGVFLFLYALMPAYVFRGSIFRHRSPTTTPTKYGGENLAPSTDTCHGSASFV